MLPFLAWIHHELDVSARGFASKSRWPGSIHDGLGPMDHHGLYGPRLGRVDPAFCPRMGILGVEFVAPDVAFSSLASGTFTDARFNVFTFRVFAWSRFKDELVFADKLAAIFISGVFTSFKYEYELFFWHAVWRAASLLQPCPRF
jgi:hypothetical protein